MISLVRNSAVIYLLISLLSVHACAQKSDKKYQADIIIYGGTPAAIVAGVQAKKMGKNVIVVSPGKHLGGLSSGGLGFTDTGNKEVIGGLSHEFYHGIFEY